VTHPIEEAMVTAPGVEEVQSQSSEGFSIVLVSFNLEKDSKVALQDIREKLANVRSELPEDVLEPTIAAFDPSSQPIMDISVAVQEGAPEPENIRQVVTDEVLPRLQRIEGVADATVSGGREREIQVLLDAEALKSRRVAPQQVISTVVAESFSIPGGSVQQAGENLLLRTPGNFQTVEDIANLQVATPMGAVRVGDIAVVQDGFKKQDQFSRLNGQEAVIVSVRKQSGTNTVQVAERVREGLQDVGEVRPDLNLVIVQDQSEFVEESFNGAMRELLIGALMASVVVYIFFRNVRNTLVTVAGLPIIILGTFAAMNFMGLTLNIVSLLALALSVGLIIDDAIVVRENVFRHMEMGETPKEAASRGAAEVALPVVAMTLTIVAVFLPIAFTGGLIGRFMNSFGLVVSVAVLISLVEAMTFAPMLSAYLFKQQKPKYAADGGEFEAEYSGAMGWLDRIYLKTLGWTLRHRLVTLFMGVGVLVVSLFGASFLKPIFMPTVDQGMASIDLLLPPGTAMSETDNLAQQVEARLLADGTVDSVLASIGGRGTPEQASFLVTLKPGISALEFTDLTRANMSDIQGLSFNPPSFTGMASGGASSGMMGRPIQLTLQTIGDPAELNQFAVQMAEQLQQIPGLADVDVSYKPGKPEVLIVVDRRKAADLGINVGTVGSTIRTLIEGSEVATFRGEGNEADIRVQLREDDRQELDQLLDLQVPTQRGFVPLRQIAHLEAASGPTQLTRVDRQHAVVIGANTTGRPESDVVADVAAMMDAAVFPAGASYKFTGQQEMQSEAFRSMGLAMLLSVVFVYMVLASQFGSFIQPFVIMLALPLAIIGGLLALLVFNKPLDMTALIGLMLLMGLVTKNSILLVDLTNRLRREHGLAITDALTHAGPIRLRPILMTTLALILGMLPVAIGLGSGSDFRQPMAIVVIGGLITSTILTLVIVPTAYSLVEGGVERLKQRPPREIRQKTRRGKEAPEPVATSE
jgi:HAE1 family hydrophobic/amphiphilic exporter-1